MTNGVVAGTVIVEIVDDVSSFRGAAGGQQQNDEEAQLKKRRMRFSAGTSSSPTSLPLGGGGPRPTTTTTTTTTTTVVPNATVFVNETVEQFLERCVERTSDRRSAEKNVKVDTLPERGAKASSSTMTRGRGASLNGKNTSKNNIKDNKLSVPQLFWSSCPLSLHERLDKLESTKPWQLNLKKGDSRLTLRVKGLGAEWIVSVKRMTSAKNPLTSGSSEIAEGKKISCPLSSGGERGKKIEKQRQKEGEKGEEKEDPSSFSEEEEDEEEDDDDDEEEEEEGGIGNNDTNFLKKKKEKNAEQQHSEEEQEQEQEQEENDGKKKINDEGDAKEAKEEENEEIFDLGGDEEKERKTTAPETRGNEEVLVNKNPMNGDDKKTTTTALTTSTLLAERNERKDSKSEEERRVEVGDEEARAKASLRIGGEDGDDEKNLNEMQKLQKQSLAEYKERLGDVRPDAAQVSFIALLKEQEREELSRKYRDTIENVLKNYNTERKVVKEHTNTERPSVGKKAKKSNGEKTVHYGNNIVIGDNDGAKKNPVEQLEHYQTVLKATQLLVQKERQKALVMKMLQNATKIPDTPTDFEALISGKDACLKYKPPPVPEFVPPLSDVDRAAERNSFYANGGHLVLNSGRNSGKRPDSNDERGTKRMRNINELNDSLPTMFSHDNKRTKLNVGSIFQKAARKRAAAQSPKLLAKKKENQRREQEYFKLHHQQQLQQKARKLQGVTKTHKERRPADKIKPEFERALMKKKQEKELAAMQSDIGAMDGLLKLAHAANVSTDTQRLQEQDWTRVQEMLNKGLNRAKMIEEEHLRLHELDEASEREIKHISLPSNDGKIRLNEDDKHNNSVRAYSEALELARENPGAFLRKKEESVKPKKLKRPEPPALYVQKLHEMQMQQKLSRLQGNDHVQTMIKKGDATLTGLDVASSSILNPNPFALDTMPEVKLPPPAIGQSLPMSAGDPRVSALNEQQRIEMLVQARLQQEILQHRAGLPSMISQVQQQIPPQQMPGQAILQPQMQPQMPQTTIQPLDPSQQSVHNKKEFVNVSNNIPAVPKHVAYTKAMAELAGVSCKRAHELGIQDYSSYEKLGSDTHVNNIDRFADAPNKKIIDMEMVMKAIKRHDAQDEVFKHLRSIYERNVAEFLRVKNDGAPAPATTSTATTSIANDVTSSQPPPMPITPAWTKKMMEAERAQKRQTETLINLIKVQMRAAGEAPNERKSFEALSKMLSALNQRQKQPPLIDPFEGEQEGGGKQDIVEEKKPTPAEALTERPLVVAKTGEKKEGDEEATTTPIQEPAQTVEDRPLSDAENEKEKRD